MPAEETSSGAGGGERDEMKVFLWMIGGWFWRRSKGEVVIDLCGQEA